MCVVTFHSLAQSAHHRLKMLIGMPLCISILSGCTMFAPLPPVKQIAPAPSNDQQSVTLIEQKEDGQQSVGVGGVDRDIRTAPLLRAATGGNSVESIGLGDEPVQLNADQVKLTQFIHLALGDVLGVNYIIDSDISGMNAPITLRVNNPVTPRRMIGLVEEVLQVNGVALAVQDDVIKVIPAEKTKSEIPKLVDQSIKPLLRSGNVAEIFPLYYLPLTKATNLAERFLRDSGGGRVLMQGHLNALMLIAQKDDVARLKALLTKLDVPQKVGSHLSVITPKYATAESLINDIVVSLQAAGVPVFERSGTHGVILNELSGNKVLVTASTKEWLSYTEEWARQLDKPQPTKASNGVYAYYMQNSKAEDVWSVVSAIFGDGEANKEEDNAARADILAAAKKQQDEGARPATTPGNTGYQAPKTGTRKKYEPLNGEIQGCCR